MAERLGIFLKAPQPGKVKTRLAQATGDAQACAIYVQLVDEVVGRLANLRPVTLFFAPAHAAAEVRRWLQPPWELIPQSEGDLGERMAAAFAFEFARGAGAVVLIGTDCPHVTPADITSAWDGLRSHDVVVGPASDGGYWLIGLRQPQPGLFREMTWSQPTVLAETLQRIHDSRLTFLLLRELADIDTWEDWEKFKTNQSQAGKWKTGN